MCERICIIIFLSVNVTSLPTNSCIGIETYLLGLKVITQHTGGKSDMETIIIAACAGVTKPIDIVTAVYAKLCRVLLTMRFSKYASTR